MAAHENGLYRRLDHLFSWTRLRVLAGGLSSIWLLAGAVLGDFGYLAFVSLSYGLLLAATFVPKQGCPERAALYAGTIIAGLFSATLIVLRIDEADPRDARGFFLFLSMTIHWALALLAVGVMGAIYLSRCLGRRLKGTKHSVRRNWL